MQDASSQSKTEAISYAVDFPRINVSIPVLLPISPDQPYHNNGQFLALLNYALDKQIQLEIVIADLPRRFSNQMLKDSAAEANAIALGRDWHKKYFEQSEAHAQVIKDLQAKGIKPKVTFWNDWCEGYKDVLTYLRAQVIDVLFKQADSGLKKAVDNIAKSHSANFLREYESDPRAVDQETAYKLCVQHVLEETTLMLLWQLLGHKQMAYPASKQKYDERLFNCIRALASEMNNIKDRPIPRKEKLNFASEMKLISIQIKDARRHSLTFTRTQNAAAAAAAAAVAGTTTSVAATNPDDSPLSSTGTSPVSTSSSLEGSDKRIQIIAASNSASAASPSVPSSSGSSSTTVSPTINSSPDLINSASLMTGSAGIGMFSKKPSSADSIDGGRALSSFYRELLASDLTPEMKSRIAAETVKVFSGNGDVSASQAPRI